jgi:hypothetical protein
VKYTMALVQRKLGHNVIHLIYPLRTRTKASRTEDEQIELAGDWQKLMTGDNRKRKHQYYYPSTYSKQYEVISEETIIKYFHPNVHHVLFSNLYNQNNVGMKIYQYQGTRQPRIFQAYEVNKGKVDEHPKYQFEWLATELYQFQKSHFLVVRLSLYENKQFDTETKSFKKGQLSVADWSRFTNRIRINHLKYATQNHLFVCSENEPKRLFFEYVHEFLHNEPDLQKHFIISSRFFYENDEFLTMEKEKGYLLREPMAFVQGLVTKVDPLNKQWNDRELYTLLSIDDYEGESGGEELFIKEFVHSHTYRRWSNYHTFYTAIDYGAITAASSFVSPIYEGHEDQQKLGDDFVGNHIYQHHCNHYLILVLLQLYYREELLEILGDFSNLRAFDKHDEEIGKARKVIDKYYNLNQYFVFDRLTNEIQGLELWKFYQQTFATNELYRSVQQDMHELNQRLIEYENKNQSAELKLLTVLAGLTGLLGMNRIISDNDSSFSWISMFANTALVGKMLEIVAIMLVFVIIGYSAIFVYDSRKIIKISKNPSKIRKCIFGALGSLIFLQLMHWIVHLF